MPRTAKRPRVPATARPSDRRGRRDRKPRGVTPEPRRGHPHPNPLGAHSGRRSVGAARAMTPFAVAPRPADPTSGLISQHLRAGRVPPRPERTGPGGSRARRPLRTIRRRRRSTAACVSTSRRSWGDAPRVRADAELRGGRAVRLPQVWGARARSGSICVLVLRAGLARGPLVQDAARLRRIPGNESVARPDLEATLRGRSQ